MDPLESSTSGSIETANIGRCMNTLRERAKHRIIVLVNETRR